MRLSHCIVGHVEDNKQFHELRWLEINDPQRYPASAAVYLMPYCWNQHQGQQHHAEKEEWKRVFLPKPHWNLKGDQTRQQAHCQISAMPCKEMGWMAIRASACLSDGNRSGIDHY